eukprot:29012_1
MALQLVDGLLNKINNEQKDEAETKQNDTATIKIENKDEIKIRPISTQQEWETTQKMCANAFSMINPILKKSRFVSARAFLNEAYIAVYRGIIVGQIMAAHWGSIRVIGPISCDPKYQRNGICAIMMDFILNKSPQIINNKIIKRDVLETFGASFHPAMYMKYGFRNRFVIYGVSMEIKTGLIDKYANILTRTVIDKYIFKHYKEPHKEFVEHSKNICNSIYKGLDLSLIIEGNWKLKDIGSSYGLYDKDNKLCGFTVLNYGINAEVYSEKELRINCVVAVNREIFGVLMFNVINIAKIMGKNKITGEMNTCRIKAFDVITKTFDFVFDSRHPMMPMGQCRGDDIDEEYDDHNGPNVYMMDSW